MVKETLKQLKSTQPDMWEQEPSIKKLIKRLEQGIAVAVKRKKWKKQLEATQGETVALTTRCERLTAEVVRLRAESRDAVELSDWLRLSERRVEEYERLNSSLRVERESYLEAHGRSR